MPPANRSGHGFDGIYKYTDPATKKEIIVIGEAKGGASQLGEITLENGRKAQQMSREWVQKKAEDMIKRAQELGDAEAEKLGREILHKLKNGEVEGRIYRTPIRYDGNTATKLPTVEEIMPRYAKE